MKSCPRCHLPFPDEYSVCPKDGSVLSYLQEWQPDDVIREKYRIMGKIGQGGMGAVYKAEHLVFEELRALKVLVPQLAHDESLIRHLRQEARITRRLSHPNAVRMEDLDRAEDGRVFIVMEYVEGVSLSDLVRMTGALPVPRVIEITQQLCSALDCAHGLGMIHRDIKPHNILLVRQSDDRDLVKLLDFGIAKVREGAMERGKEITGITMTKSGFVVGTPQYMSPEQAMGKPGNELDGRSDLYSVGVLMYEVLTGDLPFKANTPLELLLQHVHTPPVSPARRRPDLNLHESVTSIVMKALEKDPASRFQSAREIILALSEAAEIFERETVIKRISTGQMRKLTPQPVLSAPVPRAPARGQLVEATPATETAPPPRKPEEAGGEAKPEFPPSIPPKELGGERPHLLKGQAGLAWIRHGLRWAAESSKRGQIAVGVVAFGVVILALLGAWQVSRNRSDKPPQLNEGDSKPSNVSAPPAGIKRPSVTTARPTQEGASSTAAQKQPPKESTGGEPRPTAGSEVMPNPVPESQATKRKGRQEVPSPSRALSPSQRAELKDKLASAAILMDHNNYDAAIEAFQSALKIDATNADARAGIKKARNLKDALKAIMLK